LVKLKGKKRTGTLCLIRQTEGGLSAGIFWEKKRMGKRGHPIVPLSRDNYKIFYIP
jgi:hypothetical protein